MLPLEQIIGMGSKLNPAIVDMKSFVLLIIAPFNVFKSVIVSAVSITVVKAILPAMNVLRSKQA